MWLDKNRKAQGLSLNIIIIAVIALIVLVVLVIIFTGKTRTLSKTVDSCDQRGGKCEAKCPLSSLKYTSLKCPSGTVCCVPFDAVKKAATPTAPTTTPAK